MRSRRTLLRGDAPRDDAPLADVPTGDVAVGVARALPGRSLGVAECVVEIEADDDATLLEIVRNELGVRSASRACTDGTCGACRVLVDGEVIASCRRTWGSLPDRARVESYEDLSSHPAATAAVARFEAERPTRCRMCVGALGVTAVALAKQGKSGDSVAIANTLETATCMCTGRGSWRRALAPSR